MPSYPEKYFAKKRNNQHELSHEGSLIDINALLDNQDRVYYSMGSFGEVLAPKTLIFNDMSLNTNQPLRLFYVKKALSDLLLNHFKIFYYKNEQWVAFERSTLDAQVEDYRQFVVASDNEALCNEAVVPLNTPRSNLLCLDYFELNALINPAYDIESREIYESDLKNEKPQENRIKLEQWQGKFVEDMVYDLSQLTTNITLPRHIRIDHHVDLSIFDAQKTSILANTTMVVVQNNPALFGDIFYKVNNKIEQLEIKTDVASETIANIDYSNLKLLSYRTVHLHEENIPHFQANVKHIFNKAYDLREVDLCYHRRSYWARWLYFDFASQQIQSINLNNAYISFEQIFHVLNQQSMLETIVFRPYASQETVKVEIHKSYRSVKRLQLNGPDSMYKQLTVDDCLNFLFHFPNLQTLTIEDLKLKAGWSGLRAPLNKLTQIDFKIRQEAQSNEEWVTEFFPTILSMTPNLESFSLWPAQLVLPENTSLPRLKRVSLFGYLTIDALNSLANTASNLESLTIVYACCSSLVPSHSTNIVSFPKLKEIDLFRNCIDESILKQIINNSASLATIRIRNVDGDKVPKWIREICQQRGIQLLETVYVQRGSEVKTNPVPGSLLPTNSKIESVAANIKQSNNGLWMNHYFQNAFGQKPATVSDYLQSLVTGDGRNQLIHLETRSALNDLMIHLEQHCKQSGNDLYLANEPRDLRCVARYIKKIGNSNEGELVTERKGPMMEFIQALPQQRPHRPIIVINLDNFKEADHVKLNTIFDPLHLRHADGVAYPKDAIILVLRSLQSETENALLSRFKPKYRKECPFTEQDLQDNLPTITAQSSNNQPHIIEFFGLSDWKHRLEGHWVMGMRWTWQPGELETIQRLQPACVILQNAPVDDPDFQWYWARVCREYGITNTVYKTGYDWNELNKVLIDENDNDLGSAFVLNPKYLSKFFMHYEPTDSTMHYVSGLVEQHKGKTLTIYETRPISEGNKARLFAECKKQGVLLQMKQGPFHLQSAQALSLIQSPDVDYTLDILSGKYPGAIVIDISEVESVQLFGKTTPIYDEANKTYRFETSASFLLDALKEGKTVVLKGTFSQSLADHLAPYLLFEQEMGGKLVLLSTMDNKWDIYHHHIEDISLVDKKQRLMQQYPEHPDLIEALLKDCPANESYVRIKQRINYLLRNDSKICDNTNLYDLSSENWAGLDKLGQDTEYQGDAVDQQRWDSIQSVLVTESMMTIVGKTGVGKTESIKRFYPDHFSEIGDIEKWLISGDNDTGTPSVLVLDEANITSSNLMTLSTLPDGIFVGDKYYSLNDHQKKNLKLICLCNPYSYGGGRSIPELFLRNGNTVTFEPFPAAFIQNNILDPLFQGVVIDQNGVSECILNAYEFLLGLSSHRVLVTPRELSTMALLTISTCEKYPDADPKQVAYFFVYHMTRAICYEEHSFLFDRMFPEAPQWSPPLEHTIESKDFCLTDSRKLALQFLEAFLRVREFKQQDGRNKEQIISGLTAFTLEGEPSQGKSALLDALLSNNSEVITIPASTDSEEVKRLLLDAFDRGLIVRIDEGNVLNVDEKFLNLLQSGYHPEEGRLAKKAGFLVITSQNSIVLGGGREGLTDAQARRTLLWQLKNYSRDELLTITSHHGLDEQFREELVDKFMLTVRQQEISGDTPWTVRELIGIVDDIIQTQAAGVIQKAWRFFVARKQQVGRPIFQQEAQQFESSEQAFLDNSQKSIQQNPTTEESVSDSRERSESITTTDSEVEQDSSYVWLVRFLPEMTGIVLAAAGVVLLLTAVVAQPVAIGCITAGLGLFAVSTAIRLVNCFDKENPLADSSSDSGMQVGRCSGII